jgi:uncharacterized protein YjbJ (UPF0337 family)
MANTTNQKPMGKTGVTNAPTSEAAKSFQAHWSDLQGKARMRWSQLTDEDFKQIGGRYDLLVEALQRRYGFDRSRAEQEIDHLLKEKQY